MTIYKKTPVTNLMEDAIKTFKDREKIYGDNYKRIGNVMKAIFPYGIELKEPIDHERFQLLMQIVVKLTRYTNDWNNPHQDSIHDAGVYAFMLESVDNDKAREQKNAFNSHKEDDTTTSLKCSSCFQKTTTSAAKINDKFPDKVFCSDFCSNAHSYKNNKDSCTWCDESFDEKGIIPSYTNGKFYCSEECYHEHFEKNSN